MMLLGPAGERMCVRERIDLLSVTGGVPKYLEEVRPEVSVDENIRRMCFMSRGMLFREFDDVFNGVFGRKMKTRGRILRMLKDGPMSAVELARRDGKTPNGCYTKMLKDLALAGFVVGDGGLSPMTGEPLREERFQTQRMLMVVEIKRRREIGGSIADEVAEKVKRLKRSRDLSVRTALIYEGELSKTIAADHYFDFLIPGDKLF